MLKDPLEAFKRKCDTEPFGGKQPNDRNGVSFSSIAQFDNDKLMPLQLPKKVKVSRDGLLRQFFQPNKYLTPDLREP